MREKLKMILPNFLMLANVMRYLCYRVKKLQYFVNLEKVCGNRSMDSTDLSVC